MMLLTAAAASSLAQGGVEPATPVPFTEVRLTEGFWAERMRVNASATLEANWAQCEKTGRLANFTRAAAKLRGGEGGKYEGYFFNDSDVYKMLEGSCDVLAMMPAGAERAALEARIDGLVALIASAQHESGYINGYFTLNEPDQQWANLKDKHELYCAGHLIEAAVAHQKATGKDTLVRVAIKLADCIDRTFGPAPKRAGVCGHEEIELALIKLSSLVGDARYRALAKYFVEQRGRAQQVAPTGNDPGAPGGPADARAPWGEYCQDYAPVRDHTRAVGHAVRATYYYSSVTDLARLGPDLTYVPALERVWDDLTGTKMYVTGGIGTSSANEGFTTSFDLPNETAYAETCAGIGLVLWAQRMSLLHAERGAPYIDVMERALYNAVLSGVSLDGRRFFYDNPLASRGKHARQEWFGCACCPPNILRLIAQVGGLMYSKGEDSIFVNLYASGTMTTQLEGGAVTVTQRTDYPWSGEVDLAVDTDREEDVTLNLRIPAWCHDAKVALNRSALAVAAVEGYVPIKRRWKHGDVVSLQLSMPPERVYADPRIKDDRGHVAIQRGPLVYCFEQVDQKNAGVRRAALPAGGAMTERRVPELLGGVRVIDVPGVKTAQREGAGAYQSGETHPVTLTAVPYFAWANRDPGDMLVWMPESVTLTQPPLDPTIHASASHCYSSDTVDALLDNAVPASSGDHSVPRLTFWPHRGTREWVQYDFTSPKMVRGTEIYWFDDAAVRGQCRLPRSWSVSALTGGTWKQVATGCEVAKDRFSSVEFAPVACEGLRIDIELAGEGESAMSGGVLEWRIVR